MTEEKLIEELNELTENLLCPMDLIDSIDEYVRVNTLQVLVEIRNNYTKLEKFIDNLDYDKKYKKVISYVDLRPKTKELIFKRLEKNETIPQIAKHFNVSVITVNRVIEERLKKFNV
jgi:DNA invertase Pin-like site-specific DNA recombinase